MTGLIKNILIIVIVIGAVVAFFWLSNRFGGGENVQSEQPAVVCQQQQCFWTAHIHAQIKVFKNHQEVPIGFEQGELENNHSHSEKNKLHWHGLIPVDPNTKELTDRSILRIDRIPQDLGLSFDGQAEFMVNGNKVEPSYIWQDGDNIEIHYE